MKVKDYLQSFFGVMGKISYPEYGITGDYTLLPSCLKVPGVKESLLQCDEFKNTKEIIIVDMPCFQDKNEESKSVITMKMSDDNLFGETVYLYSIFLGTPAYSSERLLEPVKDSIVVHPSRADINSFKPISGLSVFWNPEESKESAVDEILKKVKQALLHPEDYKPKEDYSVMIRFVGEVNLDGVEPGESKTQIVVL